MLFLRTINSLANCIGCVCATLMIICLGYGIMQLIVNNLVKLFN